MFMSHSFTNTAVSIGTTSQHRFEERNKEKSKRMADLKEKWSKSKKMQQGNQSKSQSISVSKLASGKGEGREQPGNWWDSK
jgi:hypothetical protein